MKTTEARVTPEELDAIVAAVGQVPVSQFRLRKNCALCLYFADQPVTPEGNRAIRAHALEEHPDAVRPD